jgi:hypothetical protein
MGFWAYIIISGASAAMLDLLLRPKAMDHADTKMRRSSYLE